MNPPKGKRLGGGGGHYRREIRAAHCCRQAPDQAVTSTIIPHPTDPVVIPSTPTAILPGLMPAKPDRSGPRPALLPCFIRTCPAPIPSGLHDSDWSSPNPPTPTLFQSDRTCRVRLFRTVRILSVLPYPILSYPVPGCLHAVSSRAPPPEPCGAGGRRPAKPPGRATRGDSGLMPETTDTQAGGRQRTLHFPHGRRPSSRDPPAVPAGVRTPYDFPQNGHPQNRIF